MKWLLLSFLTFLGLYNPASLSTSNVATSSQEVVSNFPTSVHLSISDFTTPTADFFTRINKKPFGIHINPSISPVKPEKFTGYHTGVDVEYEDILAEVSVSAIHSGKIIYSGYVKGYGGVVAQSLNYKESDYIVLYGHLSPSSLAPLGLSVATGQPIGVLGKGYSPETDDERRHLHLSVIKGSELNLRGYVPSKAELSLWQDPVYLLNSR